MTTQTQTPVSKPRTQTVQTITVDGKQVNVTQTMLKAAKNAEVLNQRIKSGRGAPEHTWSDLIAQCESQYAALVQSARDDLQMKFDLGRSLLLLRAKFASDKLFGAAIKGSPTLVQMSTSDRNDLMWLAKNEAAVRATIREAATDISAYGMSALRKRTKANAEAKGQTTASVTDRTTTKGRKATKGKAPNAATLGPSETPRVETRLDAAAKGKAEKPAQKPTLDDIASDALEQAVTHGYKPEDLLAALTKAIMQSALESA